MKLEYFRENSDQKNFNFIKYLRDEIRKNLHHRLTDQFQTLMGTSGHHNGHFDIK